MLSLNLSREINLITIFTGYDTTTKNNLIENHILNYT